MKLNIVHLVGRAGKDPEVRYFESGKMKCTVTLAVRRRKKEDEPDWFDLEFWDKNAKTAADHVRKGSLIGVQGVLRFDRWVDSTTGKTRTRPVIRVDRLELLGPKRENGQEHDGTFDGEDDSLPY
ncbi:MAG: single-stranded DNA-binding protein [Geminocystis sp.]|nr:single-stranded DNA-binding protein [Geminocystis sp.]HIK38287.1 single-stranded DNA-binding protein [Geminocystis sp. M7585_C2015_104]MCS7148068.1 single-stranded DNA-binding protein [Geminocystis sp.]MCX8077812.1 single-stranded DNA-binding protein [Geminocystis sp.]MDW8116420.1 single-stranded DNA-binding protein [Geminocystis sp.]